MSRSVRLALIVPTLITAVLSLLAGMLAGFDLSPLGWVRLIMAEEYG